MPAHAGEAETAAFHFSAAALRGVRQALGDGKLVQVDYRVTLAAKEVDMGIGVAVKPFHTADRCHADDQALLLEQVQIPVDCADGQIRDLLFQLRIDRFGTGVRLGSLQVMQDRIPLTKLLLRSLQLQSPLFDF